MRKLEQYVVTIDTIYPDGYARETVFRDAGDMLDPASVIKPPVGMVGRLIARFQLWQMKRTGRLALRELSDEQLMDIGVTRSEAKEEVSKSFFPSWRSAPM